MTELSLQRFDRDGIEILIDSETGESFASVSGYARMASKDKSVISRRLKTVAIDGIKSAEIQTGTGFKTVALIHESLIAQWLPKDNPAMASKLMLLGVRVFLHEMAGFKVVSEAVHPALPQNYLEALEALVEAEKQRQIIEAERKMLEAENAHLSEMVDELFEYSSVIRVAKFNNIHESKIRWQSLKAISLEMKKEIKKVPCPRFGTKNLYHHDVWRFVYPHLSLPETTTIVLGDKNNR